MDVRKKIQNHGQLRKTRGKMINSYHFFFFFSVMTRRNNTQNKRRKKQLKQVIMEMSDKGIKFVFIEIFKKKMLLETVNSASILTNQIIPKLSEVIYK